MTIKTILSYVAIVILIVLNIYFFFVCHGSKVCVTSWPWENKVKSECAPSRHPSDAQVENDLNQANDSLKAYIKKGTPPVENWTVDSALECDAVKNHSGINLQSFNIWDGSYVLQANLPVSKKYYCADGTGFIGVINTLPTQKTCQ